MPHAFTWRADPESWRWRLDLLEQLLACYQQALGHKLHNQLTSIGGYVHELQSANQLDTKARGYLDRLTVLSRETSDLMRTFAELGKMCRDLEPSTTIDLAAAVGEAAAQVKRLNPQRPIEYHLQEKMPVVRVPWGPLHLALVNLLRCAGDGCDTTISVTAETRRHEERLEVALRVAAPGRGLSEDELALLFQRLTRGAIAAERGLDLFLVRQAAALWGGGVSVESKPGCGTTFTLWVSNPE